MSLVLDLTKPTSLADLKLSDYKVQYFHPTISLPNFADRTVFDLTELVEEVSWDYDIEQAPMHASIKFVHHENLKDIVGVGGVITLFGYAVRPDSLVFEEIFRMFIIDTDLGAEEGSETAPMSIECYDSMFYVLNNEHTAKFIDKKASDIITALCDEFGILYKDVNGNSLIEDTGAVIPRLIFRKNTLYDMMIIALTESRYIDGQRFILRMDRGSLRVIKKVLPSKVFVLANGENIYTASLTKSLSQLKNRIRLYSNQPAGSGITGIIDNSVGSDSANDIPELQAESNDPTMQKYYGILSAIETGQSPDRFSNEQAYSDHLLIAKSKVSFRGTVTAPNINTLRWGDAIYVYEPRTQLVGQYYITGGKHTVTKDEASMELNLHYEDALPEQFFEQFETSATKSLFDRIIKQAGLGGPQGSTYFYSPVLGRYPITQEFGDAPNSGYNGPSGHTGIDISMPDGTKVLATAAGTVEQSGAGGDSFAGLWVKIDHGNGVESVYAHLSSTVFAVGDHVNRSDVIGRSGHSGAATGPHLHFEFRNNGSPVNPRKYVLFGLEATLDQTSTSGLVDVGVLRDYAKKYGGDPWLVAATAWQESRFLINAKGDQATAQEQPSKAIAGYCSFGLFQENVCGGAGESYMKGAVDGRTHTIDELLGVEGQVARFVARVKAVSGGALSPGQIAAQAQRPADMAGYAASIDVNYAKFKQSLSV